jgi:cellulose synthase/poly-beta-1,6-N-acetylglucosamine synthase-like glycosyltransferase
MLVIQGIISIAGLYLSFYVIYNLSLILIHFLVPKSTPTQTTPATAFKILVPAHNEELLIGRILRSIRNQDYPKELYDVLVVADNCTDQTAKIAESDDVRTLERNDSRFAGKGYAIKYGLEYLKNESYDAVFIIDADSIVAETVLRELDREIQRGARIMQCYNGLANPDDSWFTRLMDVSRTLGNEVLEPAKEIIGLSSHLMGNGMCFVRDVIDGYGWDAFTVGEDWEYYAKLVMKGERIAFVNKARVYHRESADLEQATSQRLRWSSGRFAIAAKYGIQLFLNGIKSGSIMKMDAAMPLLLPNPSLGISLTLLMFMLCLVVTFPGDEGIVPAWFGLLIILQLAFFLIGVMYVKNKKKKLTALLFAPVFLIWKSGLDLLSVAGIGRKFWVRTERKL